MPNRKVHLAVGVPAGVIGSLVSAQRQPLRDRFLEGVGGGLGAVGGSLFPDAVDVPDSPNHRGIAHGALPLAGLAYVGVKNLRGAQDYLRTQADRFALLCRSEADPLLSLIYGLIEVILRVLAGAVVGFAVGYASHVALDLTTPRSVPVVS